MTPQRLYPSWGRQSLTSIRNELEAYLWPDFLTSMLLALIYLLKRTESLSKPKLAGPAWSQMHSSVHPPPPALSTVPCCACSPLPAPRGVSQASGLQMPALRPGQTNTCSPVSDAPAAGQVDVPRWVGSRPGFQNVHRRKAESGQD